MKKKFMLTEAEYRFLREHEFSDEKDIIQVNDYYDTDNYVMDRERVTCRIRKEKMAL